MERAAAKLLIVTSLFALYIMKPAVTTKLPI